MDYDVSAVGRTVVVHFHVLAVAIVVSGAPAAAVELPDVGAWIPRDGPPHPSCAPAALAVAIVGSFGVLVGECMALFTTPDAGASWSRVAGFGDEGSLRGAAATAGGRAVVVGSGPGVVPVAIATADAGASWRASSFLFRESTGAAPGIGGSLTDVRRIGGDLLATGITTDGRGVIARSTDGGGTWTTPVWTAQGLEAIDVAPDGRSVLAVGRGGLALRSDDGGLTWAASDTGEYDLADVTLASSGEAWAVGFYGTIARSLDGGASWSRVPSGVTAMLFEAEADPTGRVVIAGEIGIVYVVMNGVPVREAAVPPFAFEALTLPAPGVGLGAGEGVLMDRVVPSRACCA